MLSCYNLFQEASCDDGGSLARSKSLPAYSLPYPADSVTGKAMIGRKVIPPTYEPSSPHLALEAARPTACWGFPSPNRCRGGRAPPVARKRTQRGCGNPAERFRSLCLRCSCSLPEAL
ncbi:hypothetical protein AAFF_G00375010 [Aldrovandia affinis]|uniref:Uncharacterized protein n=1 Tax=Aldrovandia affinis TaxID=143900 RepID=A0AAD7SG92_9TELE|nr:hypothetical protein AAFF_G00375010 [Aldrovandia affinis]